MPRATHLLFALSVAALLAAGAGAQIQPLDQQELEMSLDTGLVVKEGTVSIGRRPLRSVWSRLEALGLDLYIDAILDVKRGTASPWKPEGPKGRHLSRRRTVNHRPRPAPWDSMASTAYTEHDGVNRHGEGRH